MKKALAILLAAVIAVSLCACSEDTTYQALTDALASGDYETVKAEMSSFSQDYKAEQEELSVYQEKYGTLIDALEAENYENAQAALETCIPEPEYTYVDITMDNWQDYFEMVQTEYWSKDGSEEEFAGYYLTLMIKQEWRDRFTHMREENWNGDTISMCSMVGEKITLDITYKSNYYNVNVDAEGKAVTLGNKKKNGDERYRSVKILDTSHIGYDSSYYTSSFNLTDGNSAYLVGGFYDKSDGYVSYIDSYEITSISGTLPLLAE